MGSHSPRISLLSSFSYRVPLGSGAAGERRSAERKHDRGGCNDAGGQRGAEIDCAPAQRQRFDRKRKKKLSNQHWVNPHDREARITKMKDGRTHLAYKAEHAVDLETGAVVAVTRHLSTELCLRESCGSLETGLECGIELMKSRTNGPAWSFPSALLQRGDGQTEFQI